jgi:hypothetical protein
MEDDLGRLGNGTDSPGAVPVWSPFLRVAFAYPRSLEHSRGGLSRKGAAIVAREFGRLTPEKRR